MLYDKGMSDIDFLKRHLAPHENILWSGHPSVRIRYSNSDFFLIPLLTTCLCIIAFLCIDFFIRGWFLGVLYLLFTLPVFWIVLHGRFMYKSWKKKKTFYAVTDKRALIVYRVFKEYVQGIEFKNIETVRINKKKQGYGDIIFDSGLGVERMSQNTGLDFLYDLLRLHKWWDKLSNRPCVFYDVRDVELVYDIVRRARYGLRRDSYA
jgi:hypothetical protein